MGDEIYDPVIKTHLVWRLVGKTRCLVEVVDEQPGDEPFDYYCERRGNP